MSATIKDIARKVGVAPSTVSRVLSGKSKYYTPETEKKVKQAVEELGYKKNQAAVELVKKQSNVIAAVVSSVKTNFAGEIIDGIQAEASKNGYNLIVVYSGSADTEEQKKALLTVIERPVMGVLLLSIALSEDNLKLLDESNTPYCFLSMGFDDDRPFVSSDDEIIGYTATKYLIEHGHRKIGLVGLDKYPYTGRLRTAGYTRALLENGITPKQSWLEYGDYSYVAGELAMKKFGKDTEITGVVAASDLTAIGILNQARNFGLRVPQDLSIISIDGTEMCKIVQPQLTSISQNFYEMGVIGVRQIEQRVKTLNKTFESQCLVPIKISERQSVFCIE
ncbi:LacI family transcriptional regulator [Companilactobacillus allii]|uniref:LacI family transcriptional regulator n=1 Tax=Companilactobacillus allii TaxID=1847728 RepID=A0A1P8Q0U7_9LACO|nr:LacI family DNA-binding transcriptional regulator [Companilactobacillus allii]APX71419.1 LacI family transcriptional regulator [Companilactobacillus allii]USQ68499.1 LacI family transcriptional regulator [Companilactobacillus allii]